MSDVITVAMTFLDAHPKIWKAFKYGSVLLLSTTYFIYFIFCLMHSISQNIALIAGTSLLVLFSCYKVFRHYCGGKTQKIIGRLRNSKVRNVCKGVIAVGVVVYLAFVIIKDAIKSPQNLISIAGLLLFVLICFLFSSNPLKIEWKVVLCGLVVQSLMGLAVMRSKGVYDVITFISNQITGYLDHSQKGAEFVFGVTYYEHELFMAVIAVSIFFNATTYALYHLGVIHVFINIAGFLFSLLLPASRVECFAAVSNIFFGPDATLMMVKPMVTALSTSQLHSIVSAGMASIDAGMIPIYQSMGIPANHLLSASFMSAPAAIVFSRIIKPEEEVACVEMKFDQTEHSNLLEAFQKGSYDAVTFTANILAVLISYVSLLAAINATLTLLGDRIGLCQFTLQVILSYLFFPLVFFMGVEAQDCLEVSKLVGLKTVINEFVAYQELGKLIGNRKSGRDPQITLRSETIASYALCGYSNIGTIGTMIAFIAVIAPTRKNDVTRMAITCLIASSFACFSTACTAALFYNETEE